MDEDRREAIDDLEGLVSQAIDGSAEAWERLIAGFDGQLRWICRRHGLGQHDASDAVQETWMACLRHLHQVRDPQALPGWLITTCRRACLRLLRQRQQFVLQECADVIDRIAAVPTGLEADPFDKVADDESARHLYAAIEQLPHQQRDVLLTLLEAPGDGYAHASRTLGMPIGSVGPTRQRAIARLQADPRLQVVG